MKKFRKFSYITESTDSEFVHMFTVGDGNKGAEISFSYPKTDVKSEDRVRLQDVKKAIRYLSMNL